MMGPGMMGHGDWAPWMMGGHHGMMMASGMTQAFAGGKLAFLKSWLGITEAQSGPLNAFADAVHEQAKSLAESQQKRMPRPGQPETTLPQWVDLHQAARPNLATAHRYLLPYQWYRITS
jgi:LTXXQ motif family protein